MTSTDWTSLLVEPKAILGPYGGAVPSLATFAPHAWRAHFNHFAIAGQFMQLPERVPASWASPGRARADVVFEFLGVRRLRVEGSLARSREDDSLHGNPCGVKGECSLVALPDVCFENQENGVVLHWRRFSLQQAEFLLSLEAESVMLYCGRRAGSQFGQQNAV